MARHVCLLTMPWGLCVIGRKRRVHAVAVRQHTGLRWTWEVTDPDGVIIANGKAWSYAEAAARAWSAERSAQSMSGFSERTGGDALLVPIGD